MTDREKALLNKVYRAVHDLVCPKCGNDMMMPAGFPKAPETMYYRCKNWQCRFQVHLDDMSRMRKVIVEWGADAVQFFEGWREEN